MNSLLDKAPIIAKTIKSQETAVTDHHQAKFPRRTLK
jgi:hypothetical protein